MAVVAWQTNGRSLFVAILDYGILMGIAPWTLFALLPTLIGARLSKDGYRRAGITISVLGIAFLVPVDWVMLIDAVFMLFGVCIPPSVYWGGPACEVGPL
ncbi:MAG: hypothetical protein ACRDKT_11585 [Actinomycetota bacterium]